MNSKDVCPTCGSSTTGSVVSGTSNLSTNSGSAVSAKTNRSTNSGVAVSGKSNRSTTSGSVASGASNRSTTSGSVASGTSNSSPTSGSVASGTSNRSTTSGSVASGTSNSSTTSGSVASVSSNRSTILGSVASGTSNPSTPSGSVGSGASNRLPAFEIVQSNKSFRNITITESSLREQKLEKQKRRQEIKENEREQQRLNLDVILSGFAVKPVCETVVPSFLGLHKIPIGKVQTFFQFENKTADKTFHHIVITFKEKTSKAGLFKANNNLQRPVRWNQISGINRSENNPIIRCRSRFSKFNIGVEKQLFRLKDGGVIADYAFRNVFYCFKQTPASDWKDVSIDEDLDDLTDLLDYVVDVNEEQNYCQRKL